MGSKTSRGIEKGEMMDMMRTFGGPCSCDTGGCSVHVNGVGKIGWAYGKKNSQGS